MKNLIKSPLNYTGNKFRILPQIIPSFPTEIDTMVDLFCGGATVGLNVNCKKIIFVDKDPNVIGLLKYLAKTPFELLIGELDEKISHYGLSNSHLYGYKKYKTIITDKNTNNGLKQYNSNGFYKLRADYNSLKNKNTGEAFQLLYLLLVYGFNNDLRFSKDGNFNLPVGKTDLNANNVRKLKEYNERVNSINAQFICADFNSSEVQEIIKVSDFIYLDPPYLITDAVYNEMTKWNEDKEYELLDLIDTLILQDKKFVLSNVLEKRGRRNEPLFYWTTKHKDTIEIKEIDYHYRSSSYNKIDRDAKEREVIILPKRK